MKTFALPPSSSCPTCPQSPKSPRIPIIPPLKGVRGMFLILLLFLLLFPLSCSDPATEPRPATILVTVTGECVCNIFLYTPDNLCLQSKIYDCSETTRLAFNVYYQGELTIKAEYRDKVVTLPITTAYNRTTEADIIF